MAYLIYIHGFNSSDKSQKAETLHHYCQRNNCEDTLITPCLSWEPKQAIHELEVLIEAQLSSGVALCGSSLGGYYATYLSQKYGIKSVLINPAVQAYELLKDHLGEQFNPYTKERYVLTPEHIQQLFDLEVDKVNNELFWLMLQEGDETLDYRRALQKYPNVKTLLEPEGSHRFDGFERFLNEIFHFINLSPNLDS